MNERGSCGQALDIADIASVYERTIDRNPGEPEADQDQDRPVLYYCHREPGTAELVCPATCSTRIIFIAVPSLKSNVRIVCDQLETLTEPLFHQALLTDCIPPRDSAKASKLELSSFRPTR